MDCTLRRRPVPRLLLDQGKRLAIETVTPLYYATSLRTTMCIVSRRAHSNCSTTTVQASIQA